MKHVDQTIDECRDPCKKTGVNESLNLFLRGLANAANNEEKPENQRSLQSPDVTSLVKESR